MASLSEYWNEGLAQGAGTMWHCRSESSGCMEPATSAISLSEFTRAACGTLRTWTRISIVVHIAVHKEAFT